MNKKGENLYKISKAVMAHSFSVDGKTFSVEFGHSEPVVFEAPVPEVKSSPSIKKRTLTKSDGLAPTKTEHESPKGSKVNTKKTI